MYYCRLCRWVRRMFFGVNQGLKRRFPFRFRMEGYSPDELRQIFEKKVEDDKWHMKCNDTALWTFFKEHEEDFPFYGGDMETLLTSCKFCHSRRVAGHHPKFRRKLTRDDIEKGFARYMSNKKKKKETFNSMMYI